MATHAPLDVLVVGAGRVGTALAAALAQAGSRVGLVARSEASRLRATTLVPQAQPATADTRADVVLLCVPDAALAALAPDFFSSSAALVAHTSGRHGLAVLDGVRAPVAAMHPAMTFTGGRHDVDRLAGITYGVTAGQGALEQVTALVGSLGGVIALVPDAMRPTYHAAMSHAANHLVTLLSDAADLLRTAGVADPGRALTAISAAALTNALADGDAALTGPVVRGDADAVAAHLEALRGQPAERSYRAMATRTVERSRASGRLAAEPADRLLSLLGEVGDPDDPR